MTPSLPTTEGSLISQAPRQTQERERLALLLFDSGKRRKQWISHLVLIPSRGCRGGVGRRRFKAGGQRMMGVLCLGAVCVAPGLLGSILFIPFPLKCGPGEMKRIGRDGVRTKERERSERNRDGETEIDKEGHIV